MLNSYEKIEYLVKNKNNYLFHNLLPLGVFPEFFLKEKEIAQEWRANINTNDNIDIYIHIPFCRTTCRFCHTRNKIAVKNELDIYLDNLIKDIESFSKVFNGFKFRNLWIGGGTPNIFRNDSLKKLFKTLFAAFKFRAEGSYKTIELHPDLLSEEQIDLIKSSGFTDISIGVQSLNKIVLRHMGRRNDNIKNTKKLINYALSKGFNEVNCDLVAFSLKDNLPFFARSLTELIKIKPSMITVFPLQLPGSHDYLAGTNLSRFSYYKKTERLFYIYLNAIREIAKNNDYRIFNGNHYTPSLYIVRKDKEYNMFRYQPFPYQKRSILALGHNARGNIHGKLNYDTEYLYSNLKKEYLKRYRCAKINKRVEVLFHLFASFDTFGEIGLTEINKLFNISALEYFKNGFEYLFKKNILTKKNDVVAIKEKSRIKVFASMLFFLNKNEIERLFTLERNQKKQNSPCDFNPRTF